MNPVIGDNKAQALAQICPQPFEGKHVQEFKDAQAWDVIRKEQADFWIPPGWWAHMIVFILEK